jgi:hypothetical protein
MRRSRFLFLFFLLLGGQASSQSELLNFDELLDEAFHNAISKDFRQAEIDYLEAYNRFCKLESISGCSMVYGSLSDIYLYQGNINGALRFANILLISGCSKICMSVRINKICKRDNEYFYKYTEFVQPFCKKWGVDL